MFKYFVLLILICATSNVMGRPQIYVTGPTGAPTPYEFSYKVDNPQTNTYFGQNEAGDTAGGKSGTYYVLLPDGRYMTVDYRADAQGYFPKISYNAGGARPVLG